VKMFRVLTIPAPFSGLVLVDPVIIPPSFPGMTLHDRVSLVRPAGAASGRTTSHIFSHVLCFREEAYSLLSKSPLFGTRDSGVFRNYVDYGLVEHTSGRVRLKCARHRHALRHVWRMLKLQ
jgi:hypothetical protein